MSAANRGCTGSLLTDDRIKIDSHLRVLDESGKPMSSVFAIGDNAMPADGHRLPATAQVANQMAAYIAKSLNKGTEKPFKWKNYGSMVFIGDYRVGPDHLREWQLTSRLWLTGPQRTRKGRGPASLAGPRGSSGGE